MDLLGSILKSMDKPPSVGVTEQQKKVLKKQQDDLKKHQEQERTALKKFQEKIENQITAFVQDDTLKEIKMEPMDKVRRSIIHEIAEVAGLAAFSFGEEDVDRHIVIYKKEFVPCAEELNALRRGVKWDPDSAKSNSPEPEETTSSRTSRKRKKDGAASTSEIDSNPSSYVNKYERLLGKETAKDAARATQMNKVFGCVPSSNKTDQRSIEQTLADIRAKKKQKSQE